MFQSLLKLTSEDVDKLKDQLLDVKPKAVCHHGFIWGDNTVTEGHNACHATMGHPNGYGGGQKQLKAVYNYIWPGKGVAIPPTLRRWFVDPEVSPWRDMMQKDFYVLEKGDVMCVIVGDLSWDGQFLTSYMKCARTYTEYSGHGQVTNALLEKGVHPSLAYAFGQVFTGVPNPTVQVQWHGGIFDHFGREVLDNFVAGKHTFVENAYGAKKNSPYGLGQYAYYGVDSIWGQGGDNLDRDFQKYKQSVTHERAFGKPITESGWSITKIVAMCKELEKEYGLTAYSPREQSTEPAKRQSTEARVSRRKSTGVRSNVGRRRVRTDQVA